MLRDKAPCGIIQIGSGPTGLLDAGSCLGFDLFQAFRGLVFYVFGN